MYKIIFIDLDGTLLNSKKEISEFDVNALKFIIMCGVKVVFASARGFYRILPYIKQIDNEKNGSYTLAFNGGLVLNNKQTIKLVDNSIKEENFNILKKWITKTKNEENIAYGYQNKYSLNDFGLNEPIYKIIMLNNEDRVKEIRKEIPQYIKKHFEITSSEPTRIEFVQKGVTKEQSILKLLNHLNINTNEMIAIGDGDNDINMIKLAGCGVAMGNACQELKSVASIITETNEKSGVGKALHQIFKF